MVKKQTAPEPRKPRADAERNRERILVAARKAFTQFGPGASMDDIANQAGVGPGTLYRHFPVRDALLEAVYRSEIEKLATAERALTATQPPVEALRAWLKMSVDYIEAKYIIAPALKSVVDSSSPVYAFSTNVVMTAVNSLIQRAVDSGDIRPDIDPTDLLRALVGVANVPSNPNRAENAKRLVDILILGSKPQ